MLKITARISRDQDGYPLSAELTTNNTVSGFEGFTRDTIVAIVADALGLSEGYGINWEVAVPEGVLEPESGYWEGERVQFLKFPVVQK